jgi:hypothetical protein
VTPFNLTTSDGETLFCWHVLPLDVYLDNENEIVQKTTGLVGDLKDTIGYKLLQRDPKSKVVVNFHGVSFESASSSISKRFLLSVSVSQLLSMMLERYSMY